METTALSHELAPVFGELRAIKTRKQLLASPLWARVGGDIERLLDSVERVDRADARPPSGRLRAVAWNIQRGTYLDGLRAALADHPVLREADVLLLSEVDLGLGRSGNRNVARELADALGMSYAFGVSYLTLEDDHLENPDGHENTLALAGSAILSRAPLRRVVHADLPAVRDKFGSSEKRLGKKRALVAEVETASGPVVVAQAHLDSNGSSAQRAQQLDALLRDAAGLGVSRILLGGDLNTTTYNMASTWQLAKDLLHKLFVTGFEGTVDNYLTPDRRYELPVFETIRAHGLTIDGLNDRTRGSIHYDFSEPYTFDKVKDAVGGVLTRWLVRRLRKWNGVVAARLDWFAGRGVTPLAAEVVHIPGRASDHDAVVADIAV
jgi:endonuclease/exonuclease/phosphatase family metal-dependent hydrolase